MYELLVVPLIDYQRSQYQTINILVLTKLEKSKLCLTLSENVEFPTSIEILSSTDFNHFCLKFPL